MKHLIADSPTTVLPPRSLRGAEITEKDIQQYFPAYLTEEPNVDCGRLKYWWLRFIQFFISLGIRLVLRPRKGEVGDLDLKEVEDVYNREAHTYNWKHHMTTHGMDTTWRRLAAWFVATIGRQHKFRPENNENKFEVLDLCTGTGLTHKEIVDQLVLWGVKAEVTGLDYCQAMLDLSVERQISGKGLVIVRHKRGDAMNLFFDPNHETKLSRFYANSFNIVTQVFGIGGINKPLKVFDGIIKILKPGGSYFMTDMHAPIATQPGEWFFGKWFRFPRLEAVIYWKTTVPLALARLWGWRDTTLDFYLLPLITYQDMHDDIWGFEVVDLDVESQRWWFGLPIMPVGRIIVRKVEISEQEMKRRQALLAWATSSLM